MEKRPLSLTIIAWLLIAFTALGLVAAFTMGSNPAMTKALDQMHMSLGMYQGWVVLNSIVTLICAYGFLKGYPWSRVLYVVWGVIGLVVGYSISPMKAASLISLVVLVVVAFFLFRENANDWFQARGFMLKREVAPSARRG
jgi:hypothetical protein